MTLWGQKERDFRVSRFHIVSEEVLAGIGMAIMLILTVVVGGMIG